MRLGKLSNEQLQRLILDKFEANRPEVVLHPDVGVDCTAVDLGGELCVLSTDPITGAANNIGALAVHICCNDAAACGAVPVGILTTLLLPPEADEALVDRIASEVADAARLAGVDVLGGHTEVTDAVTRPVISATVVAKAARESLISSARMEPGDDLVMTKWAGLEGTSIIAADCEERAREVLTPEEWGRACALKDCLSVTRDAAIAHGAWGQGHARHHGGGRAGGRLGDGGGLPLRTAPQPGAGAPAGRDAQAVRAFWLGPLSAHRQRRHAHRMSGRPRHGAGPAGGRN